VACGVVFNDQVDSIPVSPWLVRVNAEGCFEDGVDCEVSETDDVVDETDVILYPNPVTTLLSVESSTLISSIDVFTIAGQHLRSLEDVNTTTTSIETSHLDIGVYQLMLTLSDGSISKHRFVKH